MMSVSLILKDFEEFSKVLLSAAIPCFAIQGISRYLSELENFWS